ncbi:class I SAM-dependent methyltransferase [Burkholderia sp. F1]|uniref:class I SAM-dependent methyltransferase n=1 Tax=Burkholderia sp. F1 TaxID=3366817 RepID=UPI003D759F88
MKANLRRLAVEMVGRSDNRQPTFISADLLDDVLSFVRANASVSLVDLGVHSSPTAHPGFTHFAATIAKLLKERGGVTSVWCNPTQDLPQIEAVAKLADSIVAFSLPGVESLRTAPLERSDRVIVGDGDLEDRHGLGVPLCARPDAIPPIGTTEIRGGCPIVEQRALFIGADGREYACQQHLLLQDALGETSGVIAGETTMAHIASMRSTLRLDRRAEASQGCANCRFSYLQWEDEQQLRAFWIARDDGGDVTNEEERRYLFGKAVPTPQRIVKVDLGCGPVKRDGFVGIDRFPMRGVDIVCDLDQGIPLPDDSVDYLVASHSLEHFRDLPSVIQEIHRICKDRALVTIVVPYAATGLNQANPYHIQTFNEHTARFFTNAVETVLPIEDYDFPGSGIWGLGSSDHSNWRADLRLLKCEFFYMPAYRGMDPAVQRVLRQSLNDVCEQMVLQLLVVKSPIDSAEFADRIRDTIFQEPPGIAARREEECRPAKPNAFTRLMDVPEKLAHIEATCGRLEEQIGRLGGIEERRVAESALREQVRVIDDATRVLQEAAELTRKRIASVNAEMVRRDAEIHRALAEHMACMPAAIGHISTGMQEQINQLQSATRSLRDHVDALVASDALVDALADQPLPAGAADAAMNWKVMAAMLAERNGNVVARGLRLFRRRAQDLSTLIAPAFAQLKAYGEAHDFGGHGVVIQESELWQAGQEWIYDMPVEAGRLAGLRLAITVLSAPRIPTILFNCELWSADSAAVLGTGPVVVSSECGIRPVHVTFASVTIPAGKIRVRLQALPGIENFGVRTIEWRRLNMLRQVRGMHLYCEPVYSRESTS